MKVFSEVQSDGHDQWALISAGDSAAFERLFREHYRSLCAYAYTLLKDKDEAEEVVQTVFYNLWNKRQTLNITGAAKPYLYRAAHNDCLNRLKHEKVKRGYANDYVNTATTAEGSAAHRVHEKELSTRIQEAIASLPLQCGQVFRLSRFEHLKYAEIAQRLDISVKTVENHMGRALKLLREQLSEFMYLLLVLLFPY